MWIERLQASLLAGCGKASGFLHRLNWHEWGQHPIAAAQSTLGHGDLLFSNATRNTTTRITRADAPVRWPPSCLPSKAIAPSAKSPATANPPACGMALLPSRSSAQPPASGQGQDVGAQR